MWEDCLQDAIDEAEKQTHLRFDKSILTWEEVFVHPYELEDNVGNSSL
jgi:hypothetical protein